jgi:hypothetical protein
VRGQISPFTRNALESYRARALRAWTAGVDGIYMFNYFNPRAPLWREIGDPSALARGNRRYFITVRDGNPDRYLAGGKRFRTLPILTPSLPVTLQAGTPRTFDLSIGDDLAGAVGAGAHPAVVLHLVAAAEGDLDVRLNGIRLREQGRSGKWRNYPVAPEKPHERTLRLSISASATNRDRASAPVRWTANRLPDFPWMRGRKRKDTVAELRGGAMLIADRGTTGGSYLYFQFPWNVRPGEPGDVRTEVKVLSGWSSIDVADGAYEEEVQLFPGKIKARFLGIEHRMDLADRFHAVTRDELHAQR